VTAAVDAVVRRRAGVMDGVLGWGRRNTWTVALLGLLLVLVVLRKLAQPNYGDTAIQALGISILPDALAAIAQAIAVIAGGIDLSIESMMALTNVTSAVLMQGQSDLFAVVIVLGTLLLGLALGAINGALIVITRVPDIVVTLAMSFVWAGVALLILHTPGGASAGWLMDTIRGPLVVPWLPRGLVGLVIVVAVIWIPLRRSSFGLALYALGSSRLAAFRSGVDVSRTKILAYALTGLFSAFGGLAITANTGQGLPVPGPYTLESVAAIVLGGVSLAGGRGGLLGPVLAIVVLYLIGTDLSFIGVNPNFVQVIQGGILIGVVMFGTFVAIRRVRR
jgi:ribose transport system permease protein